MIRPQRHLCQGWRILLSGRPSVLLILEGFFLTSSCQQRGDSAALSDTPPTETVVISRVIVDLSARAYALSTSWMASRRTEPSDNAPKAHWTTKIPQQHVSCTQTGKSLTQKRISSPKDNVHFLLNEPKMALFLMESHSRPFQGQDRPFGLNVSLWALMTPQSI